MAKQLDKFPEGVKVARASKYPWTDWFNGKVWEVEAGTDFTTSAESFRMTLRSAAKSRGGAVKVAKLDEKRLVFQFVTE